MKQTITIDIDIRDGYELKYNPETRTIEEVKKASTRSKSWKEFCKNHSNVQGEFFITSLSEIKQLPNKININNRNLLCSNQLATKEDAEGILALIQLTRLHDEWVANWVPDYDIDTTKFCIQTCCNSPGIYFDFYAHHILDFPTEKMAKEFLECFKDLIEKAKRFI